MKQVQGMFFIEALVSFISGTSFIKMYIKMTTSRDSFYQMTFQHTQTCGHWTYFPQVIRMSRPRL